GIQRQTGAEFSQVDQDIVRRPAGALRLAENIGQLLALRKDIDDFDLIDDPIAAGEQTPATGSIGVSRTWHGLLAPWGGHWLFVWLRIPSSIRNSAISE